MLPKLHRRTESFRPRCRYVIRDRGKRTRSRVAWIELLNLKESPDNAWREMQGTWHDRRKLKRASGVSMRGADNKKPVLHLTLSWHPDDEPSDEHMKETCLSSLQALDLIEHQVLMAGHDDTEHPHAHMIINTVHPTTGRTASLKYAKERLSRWAQAYEEKHGLRIEQRVANNGRRDAVRALRREEPAMVSGPQSIEDTAYEPGPYVPTNGVSPNRRQWFARQNIVARMKAIRARLDAEHGRERQALAAEHEKERDALWHNTRTAATQVKRQISAAFRPCWRNLYSVQKSETVRLWGRKAERRPPNVLRRALFVACNARRLANDARLTFAQIAVFTLDAGRLTGWLAEAQDTERKNLARDQAALKRAAVADMMEKHKAALSHLKASQRREREEQWARHRRERDAAISFRQAKDELTAERANPNRPSPPQP